MRTANPSSSGRGEEACILNWRPNHPVVRTIPNRDDTADSQIISEALSSFPFISGPHQSRSARSTRDRAIIYALPTTILRNIRLFLLTYHMANGLFGSTSIALFSHNPDFVFSPLLFQTVPNEDVHHYHSFCCCGCGCFLLVACGVITGPIPLSLKEKRRQRVSERDCGDTKITDRAFETNPDSVVLPRVQLNFVGWIL